MTSLNDDFLPLNVKQTKKARFMELEIESPSLFLAQPKVLYNPLSYLIKASWPGDEKNMILKTRFSM